MLKSFCAILLTVILFAACTDSSQHCDMKRWMNSNKVKVLCTTAMITDLTSQIGGEHVDCMTLIQGDLDPHSYQPVKGDDEKFLMADVIFFNGLDLEHGPSWKRYLGQEKKSVGLGNCIRQDFPGLILYDENGISDPHIWTDMSLFAKAIPYIVDKLALIDPEHCDVYRINGARLEERLLKVHEDAVWYMSQIPEHLRFLVTSHDAFYYFSRAYLSTDEERTLQMWQKRFAAPEGLAPDSQLSATNIQELIDYLKEYRVHVLFPESNVSRDSIKKIVDAGSEIGLDLKIADIHLYGDAMGPPGSEGDTYIKMIEHNVRTISKFLWQDGSSQNQTAHCQL